MTAFLLGAALFLLATIAAGMVRVLRGPTAGVAILLILAEALDQPALVDVALVFALLAAVATVAFVRKPEEPGEDGP